MQRKIGSIVALIAGLALGIGSLFAIASAADALGAMMVGNRAHLSIFDMLSVSIIGMALAGGSQLAIMAFLANRRGEIEAA